MIDKSIGPLQDATAAMKMCVNEPQNGKTFFGGNIAPPGKKKGKKKKNRDLGFRRWTFSVKLWNYILASLYFNYGEGISLRPSFMIF